MKLTPQQILEIVDIAQIKQGSRYKYSHPYIASLYGISRPYVSILLKAHNIPVRRKGNLAITPGRIKARKKLSEQRKSITHTMNIVTHHLVIPDKVVSDAQKLKEAYNRRSPSASLTGDPPPGYSALDQSS